MEGEAMEGAARTIGVGVPSHRHHTLQALHRHQVLPSHTKGHPEGALKVHTSGEVVALQNRIGRRSLLLLIPSATVALHTYRHL